MSENTRTGLLHAGRLHVTQLHMAADEICSWITFQRCQCMLVLMYMAPRNYAAYWARWGLLHAGALAADDRDRLCVDETPASTPSRGLQRCIPGVPLWVHHPPGAHH